MNKTTIILNDFGANLKSYITYDVADIETVQSMWNTPDERITNLHVLPPFRGYETWGELTPAHYRILITRGLNVMAEMTAEARMDTSNFAVSTTNFLILCFILCLEKATSSEIEHFRVNRYDETNVTFDYSATFEIEYSQPKPKDNGNVEPTLSIVVDNSDDPR